jgi:hypothetical protein
MHGEGNGYRSATLPPHLLAGVESLDHGPRSEPRHNTKKSLKKKPVKMMRLHAKKIGCIIEKYRGNAAQQHEENRSIKRR